MSNLLDIQNCPTCGHPCLIVSSDEGTHSYAPIGWDDEKAELQTEIERLRLYERAMKSMAAQLLCPKMSAEKLAREQLDTDSQKHQHGR